MTYVIFEVKSENVGKINTLTKDDLVSRQSILTRDSSSLDLEKDVSYVKIEGSDDKPLEPSSAAASAIDEVEGN